MVLMSTHVCRDINNMINYLHINTYYLVKQESISSKGQQPASPNEPAWTCPADRQTRPKSLTSLTSLAGGNYVRKYVWMLGNTAPHKQRSQEMIVLHRNFVWTPPSVFLQTSPITFTHVRWPIHPHFVVQKLENQVNSCCQVKHHGN